MNAYYDTGVLLPLYVKESFSERVIALAESRREAIPLNLLQQVEMENAVRLKLFRGDIDGARMSVVIASRDADLRCGRLVLRPVNWMLALEDARRIGARTTSRWGCRTLDLIHVAIAVQWQCSLFVTANERQLKAAIAAELKVIDVRTLGPQEQTGGTGSGASRGTVREAGARYGTKQRKLAIRIPRR